MRRLVPVSSFAVAATLLAAPLGAEDRSNVIGQLGQCYEDQAAAQAFSGVAFAKGRDGANGGGGFDFDTRQEEP